jgi:hypothetical protein
MNLINHGTLLKAVILVNFAFSPMKQKAGAADHSRPLHFYFKAN